MFPSTTYTPADLGTDLAAGAGEALLWVGAAVGAVIGIMFIFIGIRKGIAWGRSMVSRG